MTVPASRGSAKPVRWASLGEVYVAPPPGPSERAFGLTVGGVLAAAAAFSAWRGHEVRAEVAAFVGVALIAAGVVSPKWLAGPAAGWSRIGHALGWFNSRVLLGLAFGLVVCPVGLVGRLFGKDPLDQGRRSGSFWTDYPARLRDRKHFERLF